MRRNIGELASKAYDALVIGGGIYGACAAWDAALRGLSVALVDKGDFGCATSANSLKIIHGGLRYLQQADFKRMRESIHERMVLMRIAPHLVHPLPCIMPTYGHGPKGKVALSVALKLNDLVGFDRNRLSDPQKYLPAGHTVSSAECRQLIPGLRQKGLTGGALWYDCQVRNSERLVLAFILSAVEAGAAAANYVRVTGFLRIGDQVTGVTAEDVLTGQRLEIRAKVVVNTSGPWVDRIWGFLNGRHQQRTVLWSKAMNLVSRRQLITDCAVGIPSNSQRESPDGTVRKHSQVLFITPWRDFSLIGTMHTPYIGDLDSFGVTEEDIQNFIKEINQAYPAAALNREEVTFFHGGLLPMVGTNPKTGAVKLLKHYQIHDHRKEDGVDGLVSVVGVKYTTARDVAKKAIDLVCQKLGKKSPESKTEFVRLYGGEIDRFEEFLTTEKEKRSKGLSPEILSHLVYNYGSKYSDLLTYIDEDLEWAETVADGSNVIKAEVLHAVREEMAQKLSDVVLRRTELGSAGNPGEECLKTCAGIMAAELGWDEAKVRSEIEQVKMAYRPVS